MHLTLKPWSLFLKLESVAIRTTMAVIFVEVAITFLWIFHVESGRTLDIDWKAEEAKRIVDIRGMATFLYSCTLALFHPFSLSCTPYLFYFVFAFIFTFVFCFVLFVCLFVFFILFFDAFLLIFFSFLDFVCLFVYFCFSLFCFCFFHYLFSVFIEWDKWMRNCLTVG